MVRVIALAAAALALALVAAPVAAQPDDNPPGDTGDGDGGAPKPEDAKRWMAAGDTLIKKGDYLTKKGKTADAQSQYERALIAYQKALAASGNSQVYYAIAAAEEKLGKTKDAVLHYRKVTLEVTGNAKLVDLANQRLGELAMAVGLFTATSDPPNADLSLDGQSIGKTPMADPIVLDPGNYTLVISADGYQPLEVKLAIEAGSESERTFKLDPVPVVFEKPKVAPKKVIPPKPPSRPSSVPLWISGTTTLGFTVVGTVTGLLALSKHKTFLDESKPPDVRESARKSGKKLAITTDLCTIGAVVAAGFTVYWYFGQYRPKARKFRKSAEHPDVSVVPWIAPSIGGVAIDVTY